MVNSLMSRADALSRELKGTTSTALRTGAVRNVKRLVVKVGSAVLSKGDVGLHRPTMERICRELSSIREEGREVVLVSSGAILAGMGRLGLTERPGSIPFKPRSEE